jgi:hypothetical protein
MSMCVYFVFVQVPALRRADPPLKESYRLCKIQETEKATKTHKGCRAIDRQIDRSVCLSFLLRMLRQNHKLQRKLANHLKIRKKF